jgi:hypothetical protein
MIKSLPLFITGAIALSTTVNVKDFKPAFGKWSGTITYLDYTSGKPFTMPANVTISKNKKDGQQLILAFEYPREPKANGNDTLVISADGTMIDDTKLVSKKEQTGSLQIITEKDGVDGNDNKKALIRYVYTVSKRSFIKRKEVKFEGEEKFIMRNEFKMSR